MLLILFGCFFIYALLIYPTQAKERILTKILDVYKYELIHGVPESQSQMKALLKELEDEREDGRD